MAGKHEKPAREVTSGGGKHGSGKPAPQKGSGISKHGQSGHNVGKKKGK